MNFSKSAMEELFDKLKVFPSESFESETIEFKNYDNEKALHNAKDLAEEISALANYLGGMIIVGVIDSSDIKFQNWGDQLNGFCQVDLDTTKERIKGKLKPNIDLQLNYFEYDLKRYLCINIPKRRDSIISTTSGKTCIRDGKSSRPASPDEIRDLVKSLQFYDWSSEDIELPIAQALNQKSVKLAFIDYCNRRKISEDEITEIAFLESIGVTKNGILNKGGLLFLGNEFYIKKHLGNYEYRFTWKSKNGDLKINDVWSDSLWNSIYRAKAHFDICNSQMKIEFQGEIYTFFQLHDIAFHEAFLNALVHRDYSHSGMVSINYTDSQLKISSPGSFYGGINSDNIVYHEPRHRNKSLAHTLMLFQLIDRAGVGVTRIGLSSLKYGRSFPVFLEKEDSIEVVMESEYLRTEIFIITKGNPDFGIVDLFILNSIYGIGYILVSELESKLKKLTENPWNSIEKSMHDNCLKPYVEYKGNSNGVYICVTDVYKDFFHVKKAFKNSSTNEKHINLYRFLKEFGSGSNEEISNLIGYKHASQTSVFLKKTEFVKKGKSTNSKWTFK
jgi:ATP-dependent DNA helicase RecG